MLSSEKKNVKKPNALSFKLLLFTLSAEIYIHARWNTNIILKKSATCKCRSARLPALN